MNKEQIDKFLQIFIDWDNGEYDENEQQGIAAYTELLRLLGIDKNYAIKSFQDIEDTIEDIYSIAMKQIEKGDYEYFKTKIKYEEQDIYDELLCYSYDFDTKKNYIKQHHDTENPISAWDIKSFANIIDLIKSDASSLDINGILNEQQNFIKWCVENAQKIGLHRLGITDVMNDQQRFIEQCIGNSKELGINITDMVSTQQKLVIHCIKENQQIGLTKFDLTDLMEEQFNSFIWCIENAKDIVLDGGDLGFLIQSYHDLCIEASKSDIYTSINVDFLDEIDKWYIENKDIENNDVNHFINEFCKKCIDEFIDDFNINSNQILSIIKNNINDPEYIKRNYRKTRAT